MVVPAQVMAEQSELSFAKLSLYVKSHGSVVKECKGHGRYSKECDWGNVKEWKGVCW